MFIKYLNHIARLKKPKNSIKFKNLFIVTYGRSGSTLLQGLLNDIDGVIIRGENYNFVYHLFKSYCAIKMTKDNKRGKNPQKPWFGAHLIDDKYFISASRQLIERLLLGDHVDNSKVSCLGFKEIRYLNIMDNLKDYLNYLKNMFPKACFVFNFRNKNDVSNSGWWKTENKDGLIKKLEMFEAICLEYCNTNPEFCFCINYKDVVEKTEKLKELFNFIGATYNERKIDHILSLPHSYDPNQPHIKEMFD